MTHRFDPLSLCPLALLLVVPFATGCHIGCTNLPFDDVRITDPDGLVDDRFTDLVRTTLYRFEGWTEREGICVEEIRVTEPEEETLFGGRWKEDVGRIDLSPDGSADHGTMSGLCQAMVGVEGVPAAAVDWESEFHRTYTELCSLGPEDLGLARELEARCGSDAIWEVDALLREEAFPGAEDDPGPTDTVALSVETIALDSLPTPGEAATTVVGVGGDEIIALLEPLPEGVDMFQQVPSSRATTLLVYRIDPATGASVFQGSVVGPDDPDDDYDTTMWAMLSSAEMPVLVGTSYDDISVAWQIEAEGIRLLPTPSLESDWSSGVVREGEAWVTTMGIISSPSRGRLLRWEIESGRVTEEVLSEALGEPSWFDSNLTPDGLLGQVDIDSIADVGLVELDLVGGSGARLDIPRWADGPSVRLGDGRLLVLAGGGYPVVATADLSSWALPDDVCGAEDLASQVWRIMSVGGEAIAWQELGTGEGDAATSRSLLRLSVGD